MEKKLEFAKNLNKIYNVMVYYNTVATIRIRDYW